MGETVVRHVLGTDLDTGLLYALLQLRVDVFVVEQECPYPELDGRDLTPGTRHFLVEEDGRVLATLRLLVDEDSPWLRIGRVCTRSSARGHGLSQKLITAALDVAGNAPVRLDAQAHLVDLYARHGFTPVGEEFLEDGIPHRTMTRT
ncbi:MAG: GNAT family N-acetyltransferase [Propionibacteriaceae bacterium]